MCCNVEKTTDDFQRLLATDMSERLQPIHKLIDDMHARLEEFQTIFYFASQERIAAGKLLESICSSQEELDKLFDKIDSVENLVSNVKSTLNGLENEVEKAEEELKITDTTIKVASIFTPLFKKVTERNQTSTPSQVYKTEDYFAASLENSSSDT